jgi:hypothetical protein
MNSSILLAVLLVLALDVALSFLTPSTNARRRFNVNPEVNLETTTSGQGNCHVIIKSNFRLSMSLLLETLPVPSELLPADPDPDHVKPDEPKPPDEPLLSEERLDYQDSTIDEPESDSDMGE